MKKLILLFTVFFAAFYSNGQNVAINNDGSAATGSAMLDVKSTTKGFMMPRMSSSLRTSIQNPVLGLLVFDTDTKTIWAHNGTSWSNLSSAGGGGSLTLPFNQTVNEAGVAFKITNAGTAIQGISTNTSTAALSGNNNSTGGIGMLGSSATGIGVSGQSTSGTGIFGLSPDGVGVKASSTNGLALQVIGDLKISGGSTNPSNGAVLTSDASGNAVWKDNRLAFSIKGDSPNGINDFTANANSTVHFYTEEFDYGNRYSLYTGSTPSFGHSTFVPSKSGVYHFDAALAVITLDGEPIEHALLRIKILRVVNQAGVIIYGAASEFMPLARTSDDPFMGMASISRNIKLLAGDIVTLEVYNGGPSVLKINDVNDQNVSHFGCHLVFED